MRTVVFDFDGCIHRGYDGYRDGSIYGKIDLELIEFIKELLKDHYVVISSNRPARKIVDHLNNMNLGVKFEVFEKDMNENLFWNTQYVVGVTNQKPIGTLYIDDRGFRYDRECSTKTNIEKIKKYL